MKRWYFLTAIWYLTSCGGDDLQFRGQQGLPSNSASEQETANLDRQPDTQQDTNEVTTDTWNNQNTVDSTDSIGGEEKTKTSERKNTSLPTPYNPMLPYEPSYSLVEATEVFPTYEIQKDLDIVMIVDSSGSMKIENEHIEKNIDLFLKTIESRADLKFALLGSHDNFRAFPQFEEEPEKYTFRNLWIHSHAPLKFTATAFCAEGSNSVFDEAMVYGNSVFAGDICGIEYFAEKSAAVDVTWAGDLVSESGSLQNFLRRDAKKVVIIVTDDNALPLTEMASRSKYLDENTLVPFLRKTGFADDITFHGFVGHDDFDSAENTKGTHAANGDAYLKLINETGGKAFNINAVDWKAHFETLTEAVTKVETKPMKLIHKVEKLISVMIGDDVVDPSKVSLSESGQLTIKDYPLSKEDKEVKVIYKWKKSLLKK